MTTCKDCLHVDVCRILDIDPCPHFADRSRFVELPIKPGEKIFYFDTKGRIHKSTVTQLIYGASGFLIGGYQIGKTVFLTREAAEQALKERENNAGRNDT